MANFNQSPSGQTTISISLVSNSDATFTEAATASSAATLPRTRYVRPSDGRRLPFRVPEPR